MMQFAASSCFSCKEGFQLWRAFSEVLMGDHSSQPWAALLMPRSTTSFVTNDDLDSILSLFPFLVLIKGLKDDCEDLQGPLINRGGEDKCCINQGEKVFKDRMRPWRREMQIANISLKKLWLLKFGGQCGVCFSSFKTSCYKYLIFIILLMIALQLASNGIFSCVNPTFQHPIAGHPIPNISLGQSTSLYSADKKVNLTSFPVKTTIYFTFKIRISISWVFFSTIWIGSKTQSSKKKNTNRWT